MTIDFTEDRVRQLRVLYDRAVTRGEEEFTFYGHPLSVAYAKHLLDYLEGIYEAQKRGEAN